MSGPFAQQPLWGVVRYIVDDEYRAMCFLCGWRGCMRPPIAARNELDVHLASDDHRFLVEGFSELWARHTT
jgi:hypothetical protein